MLITTYDNKNTNAKMFKKNNRFNKKKKKINNIEKQIQSINLYFYQFKNR